MTRHAPTNVAIKNTNGKAEIIPLANIRSSTYINGRRMIELELTDGTKRHCFIAENWRLAELLGW